MLNFTAFIIILMRKAGGSALRSLQGISPFLDRQTRTAGIPKINHALHLTVLYIVLSHFTDHNVFSCSHSSLGKLYTEKNKNNINSSIKKSDQVNVDYV